MARREITDKKPGTRTRLVKTAPSPEDFEPPPPPRFALSILEFCAAFGISEDFFYKLKRQGKAPRLMKIGTRTMVSIQAAKEWLIAREAETEFEAAKTEKKIEAQKIEA